MWWARADPMVIKFRKPYIPDLWLHRPRKATFRTLFLKTPTFGTMTFGIWILGMPTFGSNLRTPTFGTLTHTMHTHTHRMHTYTDRKPCLTAASSACEGGASINPCELCDAR